MQAVSLAHGGNLSYDAADLRHYDDATWSGALPAARGPPVPARRRRLGVRQALRLLAGGRPRVLRILGRREASRRGQHAPAPGRARGLHRAAAPAPGGTSGAARPRWRSCSCRTSCRTRTSSTWSCSPRRRGASPPTACCGPPSTGRHGPALLGFGAAGLAVAEKSTLLLALGPLASTALARRRAGGPGCPRRRGRSCSASQSCRTGGPATVRPSARTAGSATRRAAGAVPFSDPPAPGTATAGAPPTRP